AWVVSGSRSKAYYVRAVRGHYYTTLAGVFEGSMLIGKRWGSRLRLPAGTLYPLKPRVWDLAEGYYERASQVLYPKDIGYIIVGLGIRRGYKVLEAGTGSAFLTSVIASIVCPGGRVYSYESRREAFEASRRNLEIAGLSDCVDLVHGDIRQGVEQRDLDAAVLDMADPWNALESVWEALKPSAPLAVFLPTMNQLEKLVRHVVETGGWVVVETVEILRREMEVEPGAIRPSTRMMGHTGYISILRKVSS
ncbi:MAG: tRNA (adenine-N1)-methyltransferase, partial [Desulfurococcales archaeon]|nr:tRNA (adenine-N1)-methyltransferase [Desulfurococcales archaeon]